MSKSFPRVLVVGSQDGFGALYKLLETAGNYQLDYVPDLGTALAYLEQNTPSAILLELPTEIQSAERALDWLDTLKERAVVVISSQEDMRSYLTAMERGAFDYFTHQTPLEEITRVLNGAIAWQAGKAA